MNKRKKRTMNELRQTKDSVYTVPTHDPQTGELNPYYEEVTGQNNPWDVYGNVTTRKFWVVHREQVTGKLKLEECETKEDAETKQRSLRRQYHDVVVLDQLDINQIYLKTRNNL